MYLPLDSRSLPFPNISELHRESQKFPPRCPSTRDCQLHCQHSNSRQKKTKRKKLGHTNNRVTTRILMIAMQKKLVGKTCALHRLLQNSRLPSIPQGQFHRCQSRLPLDVLALRPLAAMLETLYLSLVVRRWCRAFLFDPLSIKEDFAEDVCQLVDVLRIVWRSHPVSHQSSYWSPFRVGLANVPHLQKPAHIRCRVSCVRNWSSHSTSTSASPVPPGFSVTRPSTNAANTDTKGPIWCPFCPFAASLYAFPCALAAANGWNEATSPSTSHVRQRNPSSRRLDWAHCDKNSSR